MAAASQEGGTAAQRPRGRRLSDNAPFGPEAVVSAALSVSREARDVRPARGVRMSGPLVSGKVGPRLAAADFSLDAASAGREAGRVTCTRTVLCWLLRFIEVFPSRQLFVLHERAGDVPASGGL